MQDGGGAQQQQQQQDKALHCIRPQQQHFMGQICNRFLSFPSASKSYACGRVHDPLVRAATTDVHHHLQPDRDGKIKKTKQRHRKQARMSSPRQRKKRKMKKWNVSYTNRAESLLNVWRMDATQWTKTKWYLCEGSNSLAILPALIDN